MILKIWFLVNGFLSLAVATPRFPAEYYKYTIQRDKCDFELEEINHKCDLESERIDYKISLLYAKVDKFCKDSFINLDKLCKGLTNDFCDKAYEAKEVGCRDRLLHAKNIKQMRFKRLDDSCNVKYAAFDLKCTAFNKPWKAKASVTLKLPQLKVKQTTKKVQKLTKKKTLQNEGQLDVEKKPERSMEKEIQKREAIGNKLFGRNKEITAFVKRSHIIERNNTKQYGVRGHQKTSIISELESELSAYKMALAEAEKMAIESAVKAEKWAADLQAGWEEDEGTQKIIQLLEPEKTQRVQVARKTLIESFDSTIKEVVWKRSVQDLLYNVEKRCKEEEMRKVAKVHKRTFGTDNWKKTVEFLIDSLARGSRKYEAEGVHEGTP